jgi:hypothetical protein
MIAWRSAILTYHSLDDCPRVLPYAKAGPAAPVRNPPWHYLPQIPELSCK